MHSGLFCGFGPCSGTSRARQGHHARPDSGDVCISLPGTQHLFEYVTCDILARIRTAFLNKLIGTKGRGLNVRCSRDGAVSQVASCILHFGCP
jgi:hypothetical protein